MTGMVRQVRDNIVAITSLVVALSALGYNTWRNEVTERNRNIRTAGVEMLKEIGSLQQIVFYAHFGDKDESGNLRDERGDPRMGWVDVITINDLAAVMPPDVVQKAGELRSVWEVDSASLIDDSEAFRRIDRAIEEVRQATLASLRSLD
jgi:hypothetical protein